MAWTVHTSSLWGGRNRFKKRPLNSKVPDYDRQVAHANDAVENQNYIVDDGTDDVPVPDQGRDRHQPGGTRDATDFMVSNLVVKAEVQDYSYEDNGGFGDLGDFETDVKEEDYFDNDQVYFVETCQCRLFFARTLRYLCFQNFWKTEFLPFRN